MNIEIPRAAKAYVISTIKNNGYKVVPKYKDAIIKAVVAHWAEISLSGEDFQESVGLDLFDEDVYVDELKEKGWVTGGDDLEDDSDGES